MKFCIIKGLTWDEVLKNLGFLVNIRFLLPAKIRAIRFVFVNSAEYMIEKAIGGIVRVMKHVTKDGRANIANVVE